MCINIVHLHLSPLLMWSQVTPMCSHNEGSLLRTKASPSSPGPCFLPSPVLGEHPHPFLLVTLLGKASGTNLKS